MTNQNFLKALNLTLLLLGIVGIMLLPSDDSPYFMFDLIVPKLFAFGCFAGMYFLHKIKPI